MYRIKSDFNKLNFKSNMKMYINIILGTIENTNFHKNRNQLVRKTLFRE